MAFKQYLERLIVFKAFGYDLEKERNFVLDKAMPIQGSILEIGTGKGHFTIALAQKGYRFVTLDISEEEQKFARENIAHLGLERNVEFQVGNAEELDFQDQSFDNVFAINLIHHLSNAFAVIDEMVRILSPEGKIVLSDFNKRGFKLIELIHRSEGRRHPKGNVDLDAVGEYCAQKGFSVETHETKLQKLLIVSRK